jgi:hypothetical protein
MGLSTTINIINQLIPGAPPCGKGTRVLGMQLTLTYYDLGTGTALGIHDITWEMGKHWVYIYIKIRYYIWYISWDIFWAGGIKAGIVAHLLYFLRTKWGTFLVDNLIHYPSNLNEKTKRLLAVAGISFICCQSIHGSFNGLIDLVDIG